MISPLLVFGYGNPSRGDDALGPQLINLLVEHRECHPEWPEIEFLTDFQLQIEDAADLEGRDLILFIDASASSPAPFSFSRIQPSQDVSHTTHAMSPAAVLQVFERVYHRPAPPAFLLAVRGKSFELGDPLGREAEQNRDAALELLIQLCAQPYPDVWQNCSR